MKNFILFIAILTLGLIFAAQHSYKNPPEARSFEIIYFGPKTCDPCRVWKSTALPEWRRDEASKYARLRMAETFEKSNFRKGAWGDLDATYLLAFGQSADGGWPRFVLMENGQILARGQGDRGWQAVTKLPRKEVGYAERRARVAQERR